MVISVSIYLCRYVCLLVYAFMLKTNSYLFSFFQIFLKKNNSVHFFLKNVLTAFLHDNELFLIRQTTSIRQTYFSIQKC